MEGERGREGQREGRMRGKASVNVLLLGEGLTYPGAVEGVRNEKECQHQDHESCNLCVCACVMCVCVCVYNVCVHVCVHVCTCGKRELF